MLFSSEISARPSPRVLSHCVKTLLAYSVRRSERISVWSLLPTLDSTDILLFFFSSSFFRVCSLFEEKGCVYIYIYIEFPEKGRGSIGLRKFFSDKACHFFLIFFFFVINERERELI